MVLTIAHVKPTDDYKLLVRFRKYGAKLFDVRPYLKKGIFKELRNLRYFKKVRVVRGGIEWPHEQDLSAETLYHRGIPAK